MICKFLLVEPDSIAWCATLSAQIALLTWPRSLASPLPLIAVRTRICTLRPVTGRDRSGFSLLLWSDVHSNSAIRIRNARSLRQVIAAGSGRTITTWEPCHLIRVIIVYSIRLWDVHSSGNGQNVVSGGGDRGMANSGAKGRNPGVCHVPKCIGRSSAACG